MQVCRFAGLQVAGCRFAGEWMEKHKTRSACLNPFHPGLAEKKEMFWLRAGLVGLIVYNTCILVLSSAHGPDDCYCHVSFACLVGVCEKEGRG